VQLQCIDEKEQLFMGESFVPSADLTVTAKTNSFHDCGYSRAIFDNVHDCVTVADEQGRLEYVNAAACRAFGYSREELLQKRVTDLLATKEIPRVIELLRNSNPGTITYGEWLSRRKDGSTFFADVSLSILCDGRVLGIGRDITERKRADEELRLAQQMLEAFIHYAPAPIAMFDRKMCYVRSSLEWRRACGLSDAPLAGICHYDVFPDMPEEWKEAHARGMAGEIVRGENEWIRADGRPSHIRWQVRPWGDAGVQTGGVIVLFEDMTEARKVEAQLRNAQKMDAVGRLAGGIAHEFRNALCVILLQLDLAKGEVAPETEAYTHLEAIHKAARHAGTITENLLAFSRKRAFNPEPFGLDNFLNELAALVRPLAGDHIQVEMDCRSTGTQILFDPMQLEQVIINLVCNAIDAMAGTGTLTIATRTHRRDGTQVDAEARNCVVLSVRDTGTGIETENLPHIFEPFFTTKDVGKGTGLGLAISYGIVTQGGGSIEVNSTPGKGTQFDVYLPLYVKS
jgi:PAS domain S-box-containing protein